MLARVLVVAYHAVAMPAACLLYVADLVSDAIEPHLERRAVRRRMARR